ncbi:MAG: sensor histidine kinase [Candidatus Thorarchaeota archaeon]
MLGLLQLVMHMAIYSLSGTVLYALRNRLGLIPFYIYIGILQVLTTLMSGFYVLDVGWGVQIGGGSIAYAGVVWCVLLLYLVERDLDTAKAVILGILAVQFVFLLLYPYYALLLTSEYANNPLAIPSALFDVSFGIFWVGNLLALLEMVLMIFMVERAIRAMPHVPSAVLAALVYCTIMVIDSILFPLFAFPVTQSVSIILGLSSLLGKLMLGVGYGAVLTVAAGFLVEQHVIRDGKVAISFADMISLPKTEVIRAWRRAEENQEMVWLLLDLMGHDLRNYNEMTLKMLELLQFLHPDLGADALGRLDEIRRVVQQAVDLVDNVHTLGMLNDRKVVQEKVELYQFFSSARDRLMASFSDVSVVINGDEALKDMTVVGHPLFERVFYNILSNMVKHRRPSGDTVHIDLKVESEGRSVHVVLMDDGPGIPDREKITVFDSLRKRPRHRGFGLFLVKAIMDLLGGEIWIENRPDARGDYTLGTAFHMRFLVPR